MGFKQSVEYYLLYAWVLSNALSDRPPFAAICMGFKQLIYYLLLYAWVLSSYNFISSLISNLYLLSLISNLNS